MSNGETHVSQLSEADQKLLEIDKHCKLGGILRGTPGDDLRNIIDIVRINPTEGSEVFRDRIWRMNLTEDQKNCVLKWLQDYANGILGV